MIRKHCAITPKEFTAFVDGEMASADRRRVSRHLAVCPSCADLADADREIGEAIRRSARDVAPSDLSGLASGVLSRIQAERAQSWRVRLERGFEDWHWVLVGSGAVTSTLVVTLFLSAVLIAGPAPQRRDSLAGLISNLGSSAGTLLVVGTPVGDDRHSMLMQVVDGTSDGTDPVWATVAPAELGYASEGDLARALSEAVTEHGRLVELGAMPEANRVYTEALLGEISHMRQGGLGDGTTGTVTVWQIVLTANASVSAKGL